MVEEARLARIREADEADVRNEAELDLKPPLLARLARLGKGGAPDSRRS
jgi:hypothetical protein